MRRLDALTKLYEHRPTLRNAIENTGGARRPPTADLALARDAVKAVNVIEWFEDGIQRGVASNLSIVGENRSREFADRLSVLAAEEADRARGAFLDDAALLLHAKLTDAEIRRLVAEPSRLKLQPINDGMNHLAMWTTAQCVGEAVKKVKAEGLS